MNVQNLSSYTQPSVNISALNMPKAASSSEEMSESSVEKAREASQSVPSGAGSDDLPAGVGNNVDISV
ncbi:MAG: hypothetical protein JXA95_05845 [Spirochaetales bacterium]|nr:hypothetical protein [Spirochaetales bacterium]